MFLTGPAPTGPVLLVIRGVMGGILELPALPLIPLRPAWMGLRLILPGKNE